MKFAHSRNFLLPLFCAIAAYLFGAAVLLAAPPTWWETRGVIRKTTLGVALAPLDFAGANQGQLKRFAIAAYEEFLAKIPSSLGGLGDMTPPSGSTPGGTGWRIRNLVEHWVKLNPDGTVVRVGGQMVIQDDPAFARPAANDFSAINQGQLKATATPFYDRLDEIYQNPATGSSFFPEGNYPRPWSGDPAVSTPYGIANLGQLKSVFSFDLEVDSDFDGLTDLQELSAHYTGTKVGAVVLDPFNPDSDGDGLLDGAEPDGQRYFADWDGDGIMDGQDLWPEDARRAIRIPSRAYAAMNLDDLLPASDPTRGLWPTAISIADNHQLAWASPLADGILTDYVIHNLTSGPVFDSEQDASFDWTGESTADWTYYFASAVTPTGVLGGDMEEGSSYEIGPDAFGSHWSIKAMIGGHLPVSIIPSESLSTIYDSSNEVNPPILNSQITASSYGMSSAGAHESGLTRNGISYGYDQFAAPDEDGFAGMSYNYLVFRGTASNLIPEAGRSADLRQLPYFSRPSDSGNVVVGYDDGAGVHPRHFYWSASGSVVDLGSSFDAIACNDQHQIIGTQSGQSYFVQVDPSAGSVTQKFPLINLLVWNGKPAGQMDDFDLYHAQIRNLSPTLIANAPTNSANSGVGGVTFPNGVPGVIEFGAEVAADGSGPGDTTIWQTGVKIAFRWVKPGASVQTARYHVETLDSSIAQQTTLEQINLTGVGVGKFDDAAGNHHPVMLLPIILKAVNRDDPMRKWSDVQDYSPDQPIYTGKSVGDMVSWTLEGAQNWSGATFTWSAEGPENRTGPTGTGKSEWRISDGDDDTVHDWLDWKPGKYTIHCAVTFADGSGATVEFPQQIHVRTEQYFAVGTIADESPTNTTGVAPNIINNWACPQVGYAILATIGGGINGSGSRLFVPLDVPNRVYVNERLFNSTRNFDPQPAVRPERKLADACGLDDHKHYRWFTGCQFKYKVFNDKIDSLPEIVLDNKANLTGYTPFPCSQSNAAGFIGVIHPTSGRVTGAIGDSEVTYMGKYMAGRIAQIGFRTLNGRDLPWTFFRFRFEASGDNLLHSHFDDGASLDPNGPGPDGKDYSIVPTILIYRRYYDLSAAQWKVELIQKLINQRRPFYSIGTPIAGAPFIMP